MTDAQLRSMSTSELLMKLVTLAMVVDGPFTRRLAFERINAKFDASSDLERDRLCREIDRRMPVSKETR